MNEWCRCPGCAACAEGVTGCARRITPEHAVRWCPECVEAFHATLRPAEPTTAGGAR